MQEYGTILGPVDSAFYYVEKPETPMNIGALSIYAGKVSFEDFLRLIDSRLHLSPRYRQRIIQAPWHLGQPTWIDDPDFYVGNHVHHLALPAPGTLEQLRELAGGLLSSMLDRSRPLWQVYLISGLPNQTAVFFKVHHCMVDGLAAVDLFTMLTDLDSTPRTAELKPLYDPKPIPDPIRLTLDSVQRDFMHRFSMLQKVGEEIVRVGAALADDKQRLRTLVATAHLLSNNVKPIKKLPINGKNTGRQTLVWGEFALDEVQAIRRKAGASVNDVMLSVLTAAIEHYTRRHRYVNQKFLRILMPVNMRTDSERGEYGNRISVLPVDIPFDVDDPMERLQATTKFSAIMKESALSLTMDMVLTVPSLLPSVSQPAIWGAAPVAFSLLAHTWCTNVMATPCPVYLLGHEMQHVYGYFPLNPTMGVACVVVSYNGRVTMTLVVDEGIVHDADALQTDLLDAYKALREAAGVAPINLEPFVSSTMIEAPPDEEITSEDAAHYNGHTTPADAEPYRDMEPVEMRAHSEPGLPEPEHREDLTALYAQSHDSLPEPALVAVPVVNGAVEADYVAVAEVVVAVRDLPQTAREVVARPAPQAAVTAPVTDGPPYKLFSDAWAKALKDMLNRSSAYRAAGANWTSGPLAFVMNASVTNGFPTAAAVYLDLHRGECRAAYALPLNEAMQKSNFVIAGDYANWMEVLQGKASPLVMLSTGRLLLKKGSMLKLLPHTKSATELVNCARRVPHT